jgi:small subunit ribosomal protein S16
MLRIRLRRVGAKKQPSYRIVVAESTAPRDGKFVEVIGFYNPRTEPETVKFKEDRALYWLSVGAQPSNPVVRLFKNSGTMDRLERLKAGASLEELVSEVETEQEISEGTIEVVDEIVSETEEVVTEDVESDEVDDEVDDEEDTSEEEASSPEEE